MSQLKSLPWKTILASCLAVTLTVGGIASIRAAVLDVLESRQEVSGSSALGKARVDVSSATWAPAMKASPTMVQSADVSKTKESVLELTSSQETEEVVEDPLLTLTSGVHLRTGPGVEYELLGSEPSGFEAQVMGQSSDGEWYQIKYGADVRVWVAAPLVSLNVQKSSIPVVLAPTLSPATSVPLATSVPEVAATTTSESGLTTSSHDAISGKTFTVEGVFKPGSSNLSLLNGDSIYVNMRIVNSSSAEVSFGAWGVYSDLYPNFHYIFNGDGDADKIGANTEYSWRDQIKITGSGTHRLQMGICFGTAASCLSTKPPASDWYTLSDPIQVSVTANRMSPVAPSGIPIAGTLFSVEKECVAGVQCTPSYKVNESIWVNMMIHNLTGEDQGFGAWGIFADPYIYRFFNGEGDADKVAAGTEYNWRDHIEIPASGTYDLKMVICLAGSGTCKETTPPGEHWHIISGSVPVTIQ